MPTPDQREHFLDYIRAALMLLGIPFHVSLIYSYHHWVVNSTPESLGLSVFNDIIHSFRMQVFFVISGYFSCMLYLRYPLKKWLNVRFTRLLIPMATGIVLITSPQFWFILNYTDALNGWSDFSFNQKANFSLWYLISHLWFLLTLSLLTLISIPVINMLTRRGIGKNIPLALLPILFIFYGLTFCVWHYFCATYIPIITGSALFNIFLVNTLIYLPFYLLGVLAFVYPGYKESLLRLSMLDSVFAVMFIGLYILNENSAHFAPYQLNMQFFLLFPIGFFMSKVVLALGEHLLNRESPIITYFVGASLFIYLVHHPLTIVYGRLSEHLMLPPFVGFILGTVLVMIISLVLYEIHRRIPLLRYLFSGKVQK